MTCADCKWWERGECRRFPPTVVETALLETDCVTDGTARLSVRGALKLRSFWPVTRAGDWCGEATE